MRQLLLWMLRGSDVRGLAVLVAAAEIVDEHLFDRLVISHENVADGVSADEVADFFGEIFGVIAGALKRLGHEDDLQASLAMNIFGILDVTQEDEIAQAVHLGIGAENVDGAGDFAVGEGFAAIGQHFFEDGRHVGEVAGVVWIEASAGGLGAVGETEQKVADALEADHEFHAGEKLAGFGRPDVGDCGGDAGVDFHVEGIEFALTLAEGVEQCGRASRYAFGRRPGSFFGEMTSFDGAAHQVVMGRFGIGTLRSCTHEGTRDTRTARGPTFNTPPFMGLDGQQSSIGFMVRRVVKKL